MYFGSYTRVANISTNIKSVNTLRAIQREIELAVIGITLRDNIRNEEIRKKTGVSDVIETIAELK